MILTLLLFFIVQCSCQNICDKICVCKYENSEDKDFMNVKVDCSYKGDNLLTESNPLPNGAKILDLSTNNLTRITQSALLKSDTIEKLFINNNKINVIELNALILSNLKTLDLSFNDIKTLDPDVFRYTRKITILNLASNQIIAFDFYTFRYLNNLNALILDNNNIGSNLLQIDLFKAEGLRLNKGIQHLSMKNISLATYPDNFLVDSYDLRMLELNSNNITSIPELPFTLELLDLSDNPIKNIDRDDFLVMPALKTLRLNHLHIQEIPDYTFDALRALENLELERNENLTRFSRFAFGKEVLDDPDDFALHVLSLRGSRIQALDKELEVPFGQLTKLDLQGNPWICDCNLLWVKTLQISAEDYEHFRCAAPTPFFNARVFSLDNIYFKCKEKHGFVGTGMIITSVCLLLACIAMWLYLFIPRNSKSYLGTSYAYTTITLNNNNIEGRY